MGNQIFARRVSVLDPQLHQSILQERPIGTDTIYQIDLAPPELTRSIDLPIHSTPHSKQLTVRIRNENLPPIDVLALTAEYVETSLFFEAKSEGDHFLYLRNEGALQDAPSAIQLAPEGHEEIKIAAIEANPDFKPQPSPTLPPERFSEEGWNYRKAFEIESPGIQIITLDPRTLARCTPGFGDLRIVHDHDGQLMETPFVLHPTTRKSAIEGFEWKKSSSSKKNYSRWSLRIPFANIPLKEIVCLTEKQEFRRRARLFEIVNSGATLSERNLGEANWARKRGERHNWLRVRVHSRPMTETLYLEVSNENNDPIPLDEFEALMAETDLVFDATSNGFLYYGNEESLLPDYELGIKAREWLGGKYNFAALNHEVPLHPENEGISDPSATEKPSPTLWIAAGVIFAILLWFIVQRIPVPAEKEQKES